MSLHPRVESIQFTNARGENLSGLLHWPTGVPRGCILYASCFTCSKDLPIATRMGQALADAGFAMLRFDLTGIGESEGQFHDTSFSDQVDDLLYAAAWLEQQGLSPQVLLGHSIGGGAVLTAAPHLPHVRAVVTLAAPANLDHLAKLLRTQAHPGDHAGVSVVLGGQSFTFSSAFMADLEAQPPFTETVQTLSQPLLVLHAPDDDTVPYAHGLALFEAAAEPRGFISLDGADHLLRRRADVDYVATLITGWAARYIDDRAGSSQLRKPQVGDAEVVVRSRLGQGFTQDIYTRDHHWVADEPIALDGANLGPSPFPMLLGALGACTAMTLQAYAARKGWTLNRITVRLEHHEVLQGQELGIERHIEVEGALNAAQRSRLLEIANRCPVHRALSSTPIQIRTDLESASDNAVLSA